MIQDDSFYLDSLIPERSASAKILFSDGKISLEDLVEKNNISEEIAASWGRCKKMGLGMKDGIDLESMPRITHKDQCESLKDIVPISIEYISRLAKHYSSISATFYLVDSCCVPLAFESTPSSIYGNLFCYQSVLTEQFTGTIAHSLAILYGKPYSLSESEHYLDFFSNTFSVAVPIIDDQNKLIACFCALIDSKGCDYSQRKSLVEIITLATYSIIDRFLITSASLKARFFETVSSSALSYINDGVLIVNQNGDILAANEIACNMIGMNQKNVLGTNFGSYVCDSPSQSVMKLVLSGRILNDFKVERAREEDTAYLLSTRPIIFKNIKDPYGYIIYMKETESLLSLTPSYGNIGVYTFDNIIGQNKTMLSILEKAKTFAPTRAGLVLIGEVGTGKEVLARAIHNASSRSKFPFISIGCAGLTKEFVDYELFGCKRQDGDLLGKLELADKGTLFFDDIDDLPMDIQGKLLRVLDERQIYRIGDDVLRDTDFRVISSSKVDIRTLVNGGLFREDFYYRIASVTLNIPPLRQRVDDISRLALFFIKEFCDTRNTQRIMLSKSAKEALVSYSWPGNVRQLRTCMKYACDICKNKTITVEDLPPEITDIQSDHYYQRPQPTLEEYLHNQIINALEDNDYNVAKAAKSLGLARSTLYNHIRKYKISIE